MKTIKTIAVALLVTLMSVNTAGAQGLGDIFGALGNMIGGNRQTENNQGNQDSKGSDNGGGNILTNLLAGVFSSSNITVQDMAGVWTSNGPAICFQSDNFLKKAGGTAAASYVESKLAPYYTKLGLNGTVITVNTDGTFSMKTKMLTLTGNITPVEGQKGVFNFNFTALGMQLASVPTYVEKTSKTQNIMFDATKLVKLLSAISKVVNIQSLNAITKILEMYDGLCIGFRTEKTGTVQGETNGNSGTGLGSLFPWGSNQDNGSNQTNSNTNPDSVSGSNVNNDPVPTDNNSQQGDVQKGLNQLRDILNGRNKK